jgi:hypothetical protein
MEKITNKDIANYLDKQVSTVNSWRSRNPKLLELCKTGAFCKKNDITIEDIKACVQMQKLVRGKEDE